MKFIDVERPVTAPVNAVMDPYGNMWVLFTTGRLWSNDDLSPCVTTTDKVCKANHEQYLFGIKEELKDGRMTFRDRTKEIDNLVNVSGVQLAKNGSFSSYSAGPGQTYGPAKYISNYKTLQLVLRTQGALGYKRKLDLGKVISPVVSSESFRYELGVTQPKLVSLEGGQSLLSFTSFDPGVGGCGPLGKGYLYVLNPFTGLPHLNLRDAYVKDKSTPATIGSDQIVGGILLGPGSPTDAYFIQTASGLSISAASADGAIHSVDYDVSEVSHSRMVSWREVQDVGFNLSRDAMSANLEEKGN
jgi:Tfp pilus tip-associated adhesin PilY1